MKLKTSIKTQLTFLEANYSYYKCRLPPNQLNEQNKRRIQLGFFFCFVRKGIPLQTGSYFAPSCRNAGTTPTKKEQTVFFIRFALFYDRLFFVLSLSKMKTLDKQ